MGKKDTDAFHFPNTPTLACALGWGPRWEPSSTWTAQLQFSQLVDSPSPKTGCFPPTHLPSDNSASMCRLGGVLHRVVADSGIVPGSRNNLRHGDWTRSLGSESETGVLDLFLRTAMTWGKSLFLCGLSFLVSDSQAKCSVMAQFCQWLNWPCRKKNLLFLPSG